MEKNDPRPQRNQKIECTIKQSDPNGERKVCTIPLIKFYYHRVVQFNFTDFLGFAMHIYFSLI